jgi:hypothetical protein
LLRDEWTASELSDYLSGYYEGNWPSIRQGFEEHLIASKVDDEAKATFIEALEAHGLGLYRVAPRLLFPEIERLARKEFRSGGPGTISILDSIRDKIESKEISMSELAPSGGGPVFTQFARMMDHLYKTVRTTESVAELLNDSVPNRHAALHGLVSYHTMKSSLNALIMTEFMFRIIPL